MLMATNYILKAEAAHTETSHDAGDWEIQRFPRVRSWEDLARGQNRPLCTRELAELIGMSQTFIRKEIRTGHLRAVAIGHGRKRVFRITINEAQRYARSLGLVTR